MTREQKLEQFAERELRRNIKSLILEDDEGNWIVFGRYWIEPVGTWFRVQTWDKVVHDFSSKRAAVSYCTADCQGQYKLSNMIMVLDRKKQQLASDIYCRKTLGERGKSQEFYDIINMKIQPKIDVYAKITAELEKCLNQAKYMQIRGFNNETARTIGPNAK